MKYLQFRKIMLAIARGFCYNHIMGIYAQNIFVNLRKKGLTRVLMCATIFATDRPPWLGSLSCLKV